MKNISSYKITLSCILILLISTIFSSYALAGLPAFPGASGFGSDTPGGRGGKIIKVTNLNDSGSGSLRSAVGASGRRIVVFKTGGTINLKSSLSINNPFITIAGQTAPGGGICIKGAPLNFKTHDIIIRGIRHRLGRDAGGGKNGVAFLGGSSEVYNVVIDHCSITWASDENLSTYKNVHDITISWNIISEGLNWLEHGYGILIGKSFGSGDGYGTSVSIHHNLLSHNRARNPLWQCRTEIEFINNVIYDYENIGMDGGYSGCDTLYADIIGNYVKTGPAWNGVRPGLYCEVSDGHIFVEHNIGPGRLSDSGDEWNFCGRCNESNREKASQVRSNTNKITITSPTDAFDSVLASNGAGAIIPSRDAADERIVKDVINGTGNLVDDENEVGGYPNLAAGTPPEDSDSDGMPNSWEIANGLNPNNSADGNQDRNGDGYTNIEEYINGLISTPNPNPEVPNPPSNLRIIN